MLVNAVISPRFFEKMEKIERDYNEPQSEDFPFSERLKAITIGPEILKVVKKYYCDSTGTIRHSKSSLRILWLLLANTHLETKRSNVEEPSQGERTTRLSLLSGSRSGSRRVTSVLERANQEFAPFVHQLLKTLKN
jgi:hypothetical protein